MKSFLVSIFVVALIAGGMCGRLRRQAPAAVADFASPPEGVGPDMDGPPADITTQNSKSDGLNLALGVILANMNNKVALGEPVDPKNIETALKLTLIIGIVGGEVSEPNKAALEDLMAAQAAEATEPAPAAA